MEKRHEKFWEERNQDEPSDESWEALCDGCGQCCMIKFEDEDTGEILYTDVACQLFDDTSCRCTDYTHRTQQIPGCLNIRDFNNTRYKWLPETCAYRLLHEGKPLFDWHPLISGDEKSMHMAGISMRNKTISDEGLGEAAIILRIIDPDEDK